MHDPRHRRMPSLTKQAEVQHRRNQDKTTDADALISLQHPCNLGCAKSAVAFADDEFGRGLAACLLDPFADENAERLRVAVNGPKLAPHSVAGCVEPAVAGADRVDEHEIGKVEPSV